VTNDSVNDRIGKRRICHMNAQHSLSISLICVLALLDSARGQTTSSAGSAWRPERFPISYWCGPPPKFVNAERFREIKDANFTYVMPVCGGATPELNQTILDLCRQFGLKAFLQDPRLPLAIAGSSGAADALDAIVRDYSKHPALAGYFVTDEPAAGAFKGLGEVVQHLRARDPNHVALINLLPDYATPAQLGTADYDAYLQEFINQVCPFAISYDHYHFVQGGDGPLFFTNLQAARAAARKHHLPFWNIVLCVQHGPYRNLTEPELRFEAMQTLAFGGKGLLWFTYWSPAEMDKSFVWQHAMINPDGSHDPHYDMIKQINADVLAIGGELLTADSTDVFLSQQAPAAAPVTIDHPDVTVGLFRALDGRGLALLANRNYKASAEGKLILHNLKPEQLDPMTGKWSPAPAKVNLPAGGALLIRWNNP
jgi:hypothetical protein